MRRASSGKLRPNQKKLALTFRSVLDGFSVGEQNTKIKEKKFAQKEMRPGPATRAAFVRGFLLALSPIGGMTASARQRSKGVPHLPKPVADSSSCDHESTTATVGQRPCPAPKSRMGEEAATPGQPVALTRVFPGFPPAIHPRESPAAAGSAAIIRQGQELSRFAELTFRQFVLPRNTKNLCCCAETVEDESSLWKAEEN